MQRGCVQLCMSVEPAYWECAKIETNVFKAMYANVLFSSKWQREQNGSLGDTPVLFWGWSNCVTVAPPSCKLPWLGRQTTWAGRTSRQTQCQCSPSYFHCNYKSVYKSRSKALYYHESRKFTDISDSLIGSTQRRQDKILLEMPAICPLDVTRLDLSFYDLLF